MKVFGLIIALRRRVAPPPPPFAAVSYIRRGDNFLEERCTLQVCTEALLHIFTYGVLSLSRFYEACFSVLRATLNVQLAADRRRLDKFSLFPFPLSYTPPSSPRPSQGRKTVQ